MPMKNHQRIILQSIQRYCEPSGIAIERLSHDWIVQLVRGERVHHLFGYDLGLNPSSTLKICNDKAATSTVLAANGVATVVHRLFLHPRLFEHVDVDSNWPEMLAAFEAFGQDVVLKDNEGTGGREVFRSRTLSELERHTTELFTTCRSICMSPFLKIDQEARFVLLEGACLLAYAKERPGVTGDGQTSVRGLIARAREAGRLELSQEALEALDCDLAATPATGEVVMLQWRHNLGLGAAPDVVDAASADAQQKLTLARAAMKAVNASFGSVDIVSVGDEDFVLEINSGVMLEHVWRWHPDGDALVDRIYHAALDTLEL